MVFEYMPTGLWEILRDTDICLTLVQIKIYMKMLLEGMAYVHGKNIIHRVFEYIIHSGFFLIAFKCVQSIFKNAKRNVKFGIAFQDLKPANLLISDTGILKIADFGLSRLMWKDGMKPYSHQVATRWYRAPELLYGARYYTSAIDMWSIGCIFGEMLNTSPLFPVREIYLLTKVYYIKYIVKLYASVLYSFI